MTDNGNGNSSCHNRHGHSVSFVKSFRFGFFLCMPFSLIGGRLHGLHITPGEAVDSARLIYEPQSALDTTLSSSTPDTSSSSPSATWTPTPVTSLETVTGEIRTVTVTPTVPPNSENQAGINAKSGSSGLSTGGIVGLVVGLVALVGLACWIIYFCIRRQQKDKAGDDSRRGSSVGVGVGIPSRTMSENSRYVLGTDGRQVVETWEPDAPGARTSRLVPVDPRLDPFAPVYQRGDSSKSRESLITIRDDLDYSRRVHQQGPILRATNPDE
jgi:cell wall integrity and stress response component